MAGEDKRGGDFGVNVRYCSFTGDETTNIIFCGSHLYHTLFGAIVQQLLCTSLSLLAIIQWIYCPFGSHSNGWIIPLILQYIST